MTYRTRILVLLCLLLVVSITAGVIGVHRLSHIIGELRLTSRPEIPLAEIQSMVREAELHGFRTMQLIVTLSAASLLVGFLIALYYVQLVRSVSRSEATHRSILAASFDPMLAIDARGVILVASPSVERVFGWKPGELLGLEIGRLLPEPHRSGLVRAFEDHLRTGKYGLLGQITELEAIRKDGTIFPCELAVTRVELKGSDAPLFTGSLRDITERKEAQREIEALAHYDSLTGLPNRRLFLDRLETSLETSIRRGLPLGVLFMDLHRFKEVNDSLGHSTGDRLLQHFAERLVGSVNMRDGAMREGEMGDYVSRLGGDEFTVLVTGMSKSDDSAMVAQHILDSLAEPIVVDGHEIFVGTSIGIACFPEDGRNAEALLRKADTAMYFSKRLDRNCYRFFSASMNATVSRNLVVENRLRHALSCGGIELHYQPLTDVSTGEVRGAEALARWNDPELGNVPPSEFIPVAEKSGLVLRLGDQVLRSACATARVWQKAGLPPLRVAVNVSARQLRKTGWTRYVRQILEDTELESRFLEIEITETAIIDHDETTKNNLTELKELGVQIALDDFGTGYSSLSYLRRFPVDRVKIDSSFVRDMLKDPEAAAVTTAILAMADSLKLKVVAEGVETQAQLDLLREHGGCHEIQGHLICPAVPPEDFARYVTSRCAERSSADASVEPAAIS